MITSFTQLKNGFSSYLMELYKNKKDFTSSEANNISIYKYSNEFKEYVADELNLGSSLLSANLSDVLDINFLNREISGEDNNAENLIPDFLSHLFKDSSFINKIDTNKDGKIDIEEQGNFFNYISINDGNTNDISLTDIMTGITNIKQGLYTTMSADTQLSVGAGAESIENYDFENYQSGGRVSYAFMSEEELNKELEKREQNLSEKQKALDAAYNGTNSTIAYWDGMVDKAYEFYQQQLKRYEINEELINRLNEVIGNIDEKESEIDAKDQEISAQESTITDCQSAYDNAVSTRETLESSLSALRGASSNDPKEQAAIQAQISQLEGELASAKEAEETALNNLNEAQDTLETLQEEKTALEGQLEELNNQKTAIESQIIDAEPNMKTAMNNYNQTKSEYNRQKANVISNAKNNLNTAQDSVTEIKGIINDNKNRNISIEYSPNILGKEIIQYALQFLGYNEEDSSADVFLEKWHSSSKQTGWCAAFVSYVYEHMDGAENVPDWYKNIENQYWQVNVHKAAKDAGAIIDASEAKTGDIVLYDYDGDGTMQHIGIVASIEGNKMITIEGNSGNMVRVVEYNLDNPANCSMTFCKVT